MFPYFPFAFALFFVGLLVALPATVRRVRANESDVRCTLPAITALATAGLVTAAVFLGFMFAAQGIKTEAVTDLRAKSVHYSIQSAWTLVQGEDKDFDDLAGSSETEWWVANKVALESGEKVSFATKAGKEVTVQFSPSEKGSEYYNAEVTYDGNRSDLISGQHKVSGKLPIESKDNWVNDYPMLNLKPVGQKA